MTSIPDLKDKLCRIDIGVGSTYIPCNQPAVAFLRAKTPHIAAQRGVVCAAHCKVRMATGLYDVVRELS